MTAEKIRRWVAAHPNWTLALITCAVLGPFLGKPFNVDDPLFIWAAQHIQQHPANPYSFTVEWGWTRFPMWKVTENPPLVCYYLALTGALFGWSEWALHSALLAPAVAVVLGTRRLAGHFCGRPVFAALLALFMPVFLISANTVMCDIAMLAFWVWAIVLWIEGLEAGSINKLAMSGVLMALAEMTKYYGACLIPLLAAYAVARQLPVRKWGQCLIIPAGVLCLYQYGTAAMYGESLLYRAMDYATYYQGQAGASRMQNGVCGLMFAGGCLTTVVFFAPHFWRQRGALFVAAAMLAGILLLLLSPLWKSHDNRPWIQAQMILWSMGGMMVLTLALLNVWRRRDAGSILLMLWVGGTFVFAAFCNWSVNGRSILPMTPAAAILIVQWLEKNSRVMTNAVRLSFLASVLFAVMALCGDFSRAVAVRESVDEVAEKYASRGATLWYEGHWGFQFYMDQAKAKPMDFKQGGYRPGDYVVVPANNTNLFPPDARRASLADVFTVAVPGWMTTFSPGLGASFYSSLLGPLPLAIGPADPEIVKVYYLNPPSGQVAPGR